MKTNKHNVNMPLYCTSCLETVKHGAFIPRFINQNEYAHYSRLRGQCLSKESLGCNEIKVQGLTVTVSF